MNTKLIKIRLIDIILESVTKLSLSKTISSISYLNPRDTRDMKALVHKEIKLCFLQRVLPEWNKEQLIIFLFCVLYQEIKKDMLGCCVAYYTQIMVSGIWSIGSQSASQSERVIIKYLFWNYFTVSISVC